jgi:hypothetical protein
VPRLEVTTSRALTAKVLQWMNAACLNLWAQPKDSMNDSYLWRWLEPPWLMR